MRGGKNITEVAVSTKILKWGHQDKKVENSVLDISPSYRVRFG